MWGWRAKRKTILSKWSSTYHFGSSTCYIGRPSNVGNFQPNSRFFNTSFFRRFSFVRSGSTITCVTRRQGVVDGRWGTCVVSPTRVRGGLRGFYLYKGIGHQNNFVTGRGFQVSKRNSNCHHALTFTTKGLVKVFFHVVPKRSRVVRGGNHFLANHVLVFSTRATRHV